MLPGVAGAQGFGGFVSPGALASDHADLDKITKCVQCHEPGAGVTASRCLACHDTVQDQIDAAKGFHANLGEDCQRCHADHRGKDFDLVQLNEDTFNHQSTGFALRGEHAPLDCEECHEAAPDDFAGLDSSCESCHEEPHGADQSTRPLLGQCRTCHDDEDWEVGALLKSIFDHDDPEDADYPLHGEHADVACEDCHKDARFVPTEAEQCIDCHDDPHGRQFASRTCEDCHTVEQKKFAIPNFDHSIWPLTGAHGDVTCKSCHGSGERAKYRPLDHERCESCHEDVHEGQFAPRDCDACHSSDVGGFDEGAIDHDETGFPLRGEHEDVGCDDCHGEGPAATFADLPFGSCSDCHDDAHTGRFEPETCENCHTDGTWETDDFDHRLTDYELTGAHADASCEECHGEGEERQIVGLAFATCLDCHGEDDPHEGNLAAETCIDCHDTGDWKEVRFDHSIWPLEGEHGDVVCSDCHEDAAYRNAPTDCIDCHEADTPKEHYEGDCATCHKPQGWANATFGDLGHDATGFPLKGAHGGLWCSECHAGKEPKAAAGPECVSCHGADDPHRNQLGDQCEDCHRQDDWLRTSFRHAVTGYQLRGAHAVTECTDCHARSFAGTPDTCSWCHDRDKPNDTLHNDPLTSDCQLCHKEHDWDDASFSFGGAR
jgi:hypothetical protein